MKGDETVKHLIIIGVGGFAREVYWHAQGSLGYGIDWDIKGFLDGDVKLAPEEYEKLCLPVLGDVATYAIAPDDVFICAIGNPPVKRKLVEGMLARGATFMNLIHQTVIIHGTVRMGTGIICCPNVTIHDASVVGNYVTFNGRANLGHDCRVGDFSSLMGQAGLLGGATAGENVYMGADALALPHSVIENDAYVGVRSVVFKRVRAGRKVFGNPAMPI